jgi:hypothetical protein
MTSDITLRLSDPKLSEIRKAMADACRRDDRAEYHRLGAEHRAILHAARPDIRTAWEHCRAREGC